MSGFDEYETISDVAARPMDPQVAEAADAALQEELADPLVPTAERLAASEPKQADHPFQSTATVEDPVAQNCSVPGCELSEGGHPAALGASGAEAAEAEPAVEENVDREQMLKSFAQVGVDFAEIEGLVGRVKALEAPSSRIERGDMEQVVSILDTFEKRLTAVEDRLKHHGIVGPS